MKIQLLIKHYRYDELTNSCIDSIVKSNMGDNSIDFLVIDSTEDKKYTTKHRDFKVEKISNSICLIESFNQFISGKHDFYICLNNDVVCYKDWLIGMVECLKKAWSVGIVAPLYDQPGGGILEMIPPYTPYTKEWEDWLDNNLKPIGTFTETKHVDNCAWGFTQKLINMIGLPDGNFPGAGWGANLDFCYRARLSGFKVVVSTGSFVRHNHRGTYGKIDPNYVENAERQRDEYLLKKYGNTTYVW